MLPVVMVTASTTEKTKAIQAGADDRIAKPFDQDELLARVGRSSGSSASTTRSRPRPRS